MRKTVTDGFTLDITLPQVDVGVESSGSINYKLKLGTSGTGIDTGVAAPVKGVKASSSLLQGDTKSILLQNILVLIIMT